MLVGYNMFRPIQGNQQSSKGIFDSGVLGIQIDGEGYLHTWYSCSLLI